MQNINHLNPKLNVCVYYYNLAYIQLDSGLVHKKLIVVFSQVYTEL